MINVFLNMFGVLKVTDNTGRPFDNVCSCFRLCPTVWAHKNKNSWGFCYGQGLFFVFISC